MSVLAKKVAGTYVEDAAPRLPGTLAWATQECRNGGLAQHVRAFCEAQFEIVDPSLVLVEQMTSDELCCRIPCRCYDHESAGTFEADVRFRMNPRTGEAERFYV